MDRCERVFREEREESLLSVMFHEPGALDQTSFTQPALYALESALTELWSGVGIRPEAVLGHSVGELAAASAAGVFGLEDGMRLAARRGALMGSLPAGGGMTAVVADEMLVADAIEAVNAVSGDVDLALAAANGAHQVVSGSLDLLSVLEERLSEEGVRTERLVTSHAFHSELMDPVLEELEAAVDGVGISAPSLPLVSNVTGRLVGTKEKLGAGYWRRHARSPVAFASGLQALRELGISVLIEIGPRPVLGPMALRAWPDSTPGPVILSSLGPQTAFAEAVGAAYEAGLAISFGGLFTGERRRSISLPTYPFERHRYWVGRDGYGVDRGHPLLGVRHDLASGQVAFETQFSARAPRWLNDHRVYGRIVAPGALYAAQAAAASSGPGPVALEGVRIERALVLPDTGADGDKGGRRVQLLLEADDGSGNRSFAVFSRTADAESWVRHASGQMSSGAAVTAVPRSAAALDRLRAELPPVAVATLYGQMVSSGIWHGPSFQTLTAVWSGGTEALGEVNLPKDAPETGSPIHPALLDGCSHLASAIGHPRAAGAGALWLPIGWDRLVLSGPLPTRIFCHARHTGATETDAGGPAIRRADLLLYTPDGTALGAVEGFALRRTTRSELLRVSESTAEMLYELAWIEDPGAPSPVDSPPGPDVGPAETTEEPGVWLIAAPHGRRDLDFALALADALRERRQTVLVAAGAEGPGVTTLPVGGREAWGALAEDLSAKRPLAGIVDLGGLPGRGTTAAAAELAEDVRVSASSSLALVQGLGDANVLPLSGLWFVTSGGQVIGEGNGGELSGSVLWGFGRTVAQEMTALGVRMVDLDPEEPESLGRLVGELLEPDQETQVAYRGGRRLLARLVRTGGRVELPAGGAWRLRRDRGGSLRDLEAETVESRVLGSGEVRAAVEATGVNFHDVLVGMGLVDVDSPLGGEFCGRVLEVGPEVTGMSAGDRVVGFGPGTFGPEVVTLESVLAPAPSGRPAAALATVPVAYVTAALAFEFGELEAGDAVLVHAGTGGVGHAAIQWARSAGLKVFGTASRPKQEYLRSLGVAGVFDSRSPDFGDAILEATGGTGVQLVLNSLTGEGFIEASLSCLAEGGRFVEIGKRGIWSAEEMASARPDVRYLGVGGGSLAGGGPVAGGFGAAGGDGAVGLGRVGSASVSAVSAVGGGACDGKDAGGASRREAGAGAVGAGGRRAAFRPELPGDGWSWRDRDAGCGLAGGAGCGSDRAERTSCSGGGSGGGDCGVAFPGCGGPGGAL